jgi:hypothetical protein
MVGKCCKSGQIESPKGVCCLRDKINVDRDCCAFGAIPAGHGCVVRKNRRLIAFMETWIKVNAAWT